MAKPLRIGVFGGTFDPIHNAHLELARAALAAAHLDKVIFVVAARPPHKQDDTVAAPKDRIAMVQAAVAGEPKFEVSDLELKREGLSYMADTLRELAPLYPREQFFLIIGLDSLLDLPTWKDPEAILAIAHLLVVPRPGDERDIPESLQGAFDFLPFEETDVSSTGIRGSIAAGESVETLVPKAVIQLILEKRIYAEAGRFPYHRAEEFLKLLRVRVRDKTVQHSTSVTETMLSVADRAGITPEQAVTAGLLHDLCKAMKPEALRRRAEEYGISQYLGSPNLLHGPVAAEECRRDLGIQDEHVLDAIRWHTTGRAEWNRVGMALFYADFAEPGRNHEAAAEARRILEDDGFEAAVRYAVDQKFNHVKKKFKLDPNSRAFEEWVEREFA